MTTYSNPWHKSGHPEYGPKVYETDAKPIDYRGFQIFERLKGVCWDVVKDGACVHQMAGPNGARRAIDADLKLSEFGQYWDGHKYTFDGHD